MPSLHELIGSLKEGANKTLQLREVEEAAKLAREAQLASKLDRCRAIGASLINLTSLVTSLEADANGKGFKGKFGEHGERLSGTFRYELLQRSDDIHYIQYEDFEDPNKLSVIIEPDGIQLYSGKHGSKHRIELAEQEVGEAQVTFLAWAGRVAPERTDEIAELLLQHPEIGDR